jgi:hypothetical protein
MSYCHRLLASLFGIINLFAIIPISLISYVVGVRFCFDTLGIDLSVSLVLGFIVMIVAVGLINGLAAVFLSMLDRLEEMRHDREAILEALHHIRDITYHQKPQQSHDHGKEDNASWVRVEPSPPYQPERVSTTPTKKGAKTKKAGRQVAQKGKTRKTASKAKIKA